MAALKKSTRKLFLASLRPQRLLGGARYRLQNFHDNPPPRLESVMTTITPCEDDFRHMSFTFALIALSACVSRVGGPLTQDKYVAFREAFPLSGSICGKIRSLFALAYASQTPFEHYVTQVKYTFTDNAPLFISLVDRLFRIASADGQPPRESERLLARIAFMLGLSPGDYTEICERYTRPQPAHKTLGVAKRANASAVKKRYRELMRLYHPDRFASEGISPEVEMLLRLKTFEINEAYRRLSGRRMAVDGAREKEYS